MIFLKNNWGRQREMVRCLSPKESYFMWSTIIAFEIYSVKSKYYIDFAIRNKISPINVPSCKTREQQQQKEQ